MRISVLMAVWAKETPAFLEDSLESLRRQTLKPSEIVLVLDGPLPPELMKVISRHKKRKNPVLRTLPLAQSHGLGLALQKGLHHCRQEWVARMDSDDICLPDRLERQADYLSLYPEISMVGGYILEFRDNPDKPFSLRKVPVSWESVRTFAKFRNPMNHMTMMFRKKDVLAAGGYHGTLFEDYDLVCRMLAAGRKLENLPQALVLARFNESSLERRRGWSYIKTELSHLRGMRSMGLINGIEWASLSLLRVLARLLPLVILKGVYRKFLRKAPVLGPSER